jgi:1-acyl-sn-glycerol-3-phosphate acyltransferase
MFTRYFRRWMGKSFHAVRLSRAGKPPALDGRPLVVVLNHPSWWDPLMGVVLAELFEGYKHFVPIDAAALRQYRLFEPLGFFGVEVGTPAGALAFLRTSEAILSHPRHAIWVTAQGKFTDPRVRPVALRQGVGHLLRRLDGAVVLPLAIEYPFWQERYPEALAHFGSPIAIERGKDRTVGEWMTRIEAGLTEALDELAREAQTQDEARFETLVGGNVGVGGIYDWWRRLKARLRGRRFRGGHVEGQRQAAANLSPGGLS